MNFKPAHQVPETSDKIVIMATRFPDIHPAQPRDNRELTDNDWAVLIPRPDAPGTG